MAAELWIRDGGGTPRLIKELWIRDGGGVPRLIKELWACDGGGVARKIFQYFTVQSPLDWAVFTLKVFPVDATSSLTFNADGTSTILGNAITGGSWGSPTVAGIGTNYWVKRVFASGDPLTAGIANNTWVQLSSSRLIGSLTASGVSYRISTHNLYLATAASDAAIVASGSFTLECLVES